MTVSRAARAANLALALVFGAILRFWPVISNPVSAGFYALAQEVVRVRASLQRCRNALARVPGVDLPVPKETPLRNAITLEVPLSLLREAQAALKEEV